MNTKYIMSNEVYINYSCIKNETTSYKRWDSQAEAVNTLPETCVEIVLFMSDEAYFNAKEEMVDYCINEILFCIVL